MARSMERLCAHTAVPFMVLLGLGLFGITGWLPPLDPTLSGEQLQQLFSGDRTRIRIGMTVLALGSVFWWSFSAAICMQMQAIEGKSHPLSYVQLITASGTAMVVMLAAYLWLAAAYRPDMPVALLQLFNDLAWLMIIGAYPPVLLQALAIGLCILRDKSPRLRFPRWVGFVNFWAAILFLPGALLPFFQTGPFTWKGLIGFWLVAVVFFGWIVLMWLMTLRAIRISEAIEREPT